MHFTSHSCFRFVLVKNESGVNGRPMLQVDLPPQALKSLARTHIEAKPFNGQ